MLLYYHIFADAGRELLQLVLLLRYNIPFAHTKNFPSHLYSYLLWSTLCIGAAAVSIDRHAVNLFKGRNSRTEFYFDFLFLLLVEPLGRYKVPGAPANSKKGVAAEAPAQCTIKRNPRDKRH